MSNTTDEMIAVLCAFKEGKPIEVLNAYGNWVPWDGGAKFNFQFATYRIKPEPPKPDYLAGHKASGLKVGDWVTVTRVAESRESGWKNGWNPDMDKAVGEVARIEIDSDSAGFSLSGKGRGYRYPFFVLEKVEPLEFWVNTYRGGSPCLHASRDLAISAVMPGALRTAVHMREVIGGEA